MTETTTSQQQQERTFGAPLRPREDVGFLRGEAKFTADYTPPGTLHMALLRSEHGHARIVKIDTTRAKAMPGVRAVITGADIADKLLPLPCVWIPGGVESHFPPHPYGMPGAGFVLENKGKGEKRIEGRNIRKRRGMKYRADYMRWKK